MRPVRPQWPTEGHRYNYQQRYINFDIRAGERVLDIGSGSDPFPFATHLADRFLEPTEHRDGALVRNEKPLIAADVHHLPFSDKSFDFVYCAHILEHVDDPIRACSEIMRVGRRGYIETPTMGSDVLSAWAEHIHKWHVVASPDTLCFFEYSPREARGIASTAWLDMLYGRRYHPLQEAFYENQDLFNVMFLWKGSFRVLVFRRDGRIESLNLSTEPEPMLAEVSISRP